MIRKIGVGVIGLGVGLFHAQAVLKNRNANLIGITDFDKSKTLNLKKKNSKIRVFKNANELIKNNKISLVIIASYDNYHFKHIKNCIKYKKNFFIEKPLCLNLLEFKKIKNLLKKNKTIKFSSNFVLRNSPQFVFLKKELNNKKFGKIYHLSAEYNFGRLKKITNGWRGKIPYYSVSHGGGIHLIDLVIFLLNKLPKSCVSFGNKISTKNSNFKFNDSVTSILKFENDISMNLTSNFGCVLPHHHTLKIYGTKLTFVQEFNNCKIFDSRNKKSKPRIINFKYKKKDKSKILNSFINSLLYKRKSIVSQKDVLHSMLTSLYIEKSVKTKKWEAIIS